MALHGDLKTFPVTDLLQWLENARKTGVVMVESRRVTRHVLVREGRIEACSSNDPPTLLGQALLAHGRIDEDTLQRALERQERTGENLGTILVDRGACTSEDVVAHISAKAEETINALFDCDDATFRYADDADIPGNVIEVSLTIQDVLLRGLQRYDEMRRVREVFPSRGIVLARTEVAPPGSVVRSRVAKRILGLVDGERTLAELLLRSRASEYLTSKLLFELHRKGVVRITEVREVAETAAPQAVGATVGAAEGHARAAASPAATPAGRGGEIRDAGAEIAVAENLLQRREPDAALAVLYSTSRAYPGETAVRDLIVRAESAYMERAASELDTSHVPHAVFGAARDAVPLSPGESYVLDLVDGASDVKAMMWIAPMRSVDLLRALRGLVDKGLVELREAAREA